MRTGISIAMTAATIVLGELPCGLGAGAGGARVEPSVGKTPYRGLVLEMTGDDKSPVNVRNPEGKPVLDPYYAFERKGLALLDRDYTLRLDGGCFFSAATEEYLGGCLRNAGGELTLSAYIKPAALKTATVGCVIGYGPAEAAFRLALLQEGSALFLSLRGKDSRRIEILKLVDLTPFHLAVVVGRDGVAVYRNGDTAGVQPGAVGDFSDWEDGTLYLGNNGSGTNAWKGWIERFELRNQALSAGEVKDRASKLLDEIQARDPVPAIEIEGTLTTRSTYTMPWAEGFTYREVLSICEYKVNKVLKGDFKGDKMRVAEWMYVDRIFLTNSMRKPGAVRRFRVESLDDNPQLSTTQRDDTLDLDMDAVVHYDLSPLEALPEAEQPKPEKK